MYEKEIKQVIELFDLIEIIDFQQIHDVQIIRGADFQYTCHIDKKEFGSALTTLGALVFGIKQFKDNEK